MKIELKEINYDNGNFRIENLSFDVKEGSVNGIGGKNGSGKTTILKMMYRYLKPSGGAILIDGKEIKDFSPRQLSRKTSVIQQETPNPLSLTVYDVVSMSAYSGQYDEKKLDEALEMCGILHLKGRSFNELSGGERRLVMFSAAIYQDAEIMLMDEPTTFLDVDKELLVFQIIRKIREMGKTIVIVLHDISDLYNICDHVILLKNGFVASQGSPAETFTNGLLKSVYGVDFLSYDTIEGKRFTAVRR